MHWLVPFPLFSMCCWCAWYSGSSSALWGSICLLESSTTASTAPQRNASPWMWSTTRVTVWPWCTPMRRTGSMWRSTMTMWDSATSLYCKLYVYYFITYGTHATINSYNMTIFAWSFEEKKDQANSELKRVKHLFKLNYGKFNKKRNLVQTPSIIISEFNHIYSQRTVLSCPFLFMHRKTER